MKILIAAALFASATAMAQQPPLPDAQPVPLWSGQAPGALGTADTDVPTLTPYWPRNGLAWTAVIVCPGGGYVNLAMNHEGRQVANYLNSLGIAAFVLKYRLGPRYHHPVEIGDAQRAIRMVRAHAKEWRIDPAHIGILGFSAGGHLAASASTHFDAGQANAADAIDQVSSRPDFSVLGYPVISLVAPWTHQASRKALLGDNPDPELAKSLSGENAVTAQTPPTFIFQTNADTTVPAENSIQYFLALRKAGVVAEMHIFQRGSHGLGLGGGDFALDEWPKLLANWMRGNGFLK